MNSIDSQHPLIAPQRIKVHSQPTLLIPFPNSIELESQAIQWLSNLLAEAMEEDLDTLPTSPPLPLPLELPSDPQEPPPKDSISSSLTPKLFTPIATKNQRIYQNFELLSAIEKHDVMTLMEIRNHAFPLLVEAVGGKVPLTFAMTQGKTHRDMAILLTGMISKRVNEISDLDLSPSNPHATSIKSILRAIRANLSLAIKYGLANDESTLIASYFQIIIMTDSKWLTLATTEVSLAIRTGNSSKPVGTARKLVEKWMGRELGKSLELSSVGDFIGNATGDLIILGIWTVATDLLSEEEIIPLHFFARDDRIVKTLQERVEALERTGKYMKLSISLRKQIEASLDILLKTNIGWKEKIELLTKLLDD